MVSAFTWLMELTFAVISSMLAVSSSETDAIFATSLEAASTEVAILSGSFLIFSLITPKGGRLFFSRQYVNGVEPLPGVARSRCLMCYENSRAGGRGGELVRGLILWALKATNSIVAFKVWLPASTFTCRPKNRWSEPLFWVCGAALKKCFLLEFVA